jgi:hypothetical protein
MLLKCKESQKGTKKFSTINGLKKETAYREITSCSTVIWNHKD